MLRRDLCAWGAWQLLRACRVKVGVRRGSKVVLAKGLARAVLVVQQPQRGGGVRLRDVVLLRSTKAVSDRLYRGKQCKPQLLTSAKKPAGRPRPAARSASSRSARSSHWRMNLRLPCDAVHGQLSRVGQPPASWLWGLPP